MSGIHLERDARGVTTIWLHNEGRKNALSNAMVEQLVAAFRIAGEDVDCRAIVLRGRDGIFCAGRDLVDLSRLQEAPRDEIDRMYDLMEAMNRAVYYCPCSVIGVVEGYAIGIGVMLASWTDITIADENALFAYPEVKYGITPFGAVPTMLQSMHAKSVADLLLTGRRFKASEALRLGIVSQVAASNEIEESLQATLDQVLGNNGRAMMETKAFIRRMETMGFGDGLIEATRSAKAKTGNPDTRDGLSVFRRPD